MEKGFLLTVSKDIRDYIGVPEGNSLETSDTKAIRRELSLILENKHVDGNALEAKWFPQIDARIFISHSHKDRNLAVSVARVLEKNYQAKSFIDSEVWGYFETLAQQYDATNAHNMLTTAIAKMIDRCHYFVFLDTPNSRDINNLTQSSWLYYELTLSKILTPTRDHLFEGMREFSDIEYKAPTRHLQEITFMDLAQICAKEKQTKENFHRLLNHRF